LKGGEMKIILETFQPCDINNPDFKHKSKVHDWRNYILYEFQEIWKELPLITRYALIIMAEGQADKEEWE